MATLTEQAAFATALADDVTGPLRGALISAAVQIFNEDVDAPNHEVRLALARSVLRSTSTLEVFAWALSTNSTVVDKWTSGDRDGAYADFAFVISTVWDAIATTATTW